MVQEILRADEAGDDGVDNASSDDGAGDIVVLGGTAPAGTATKRKPGRPAARRASQIVAVETQLRRALGTKVVVHANSKGAGRIVIPFGSVEEFQRLLDHITD